MFKYILTLSPNYPNVGEVTIIKAIRAVTGFGLQQARELYDLAQIAPTQFETVIHVETSRFNSEMDGYAKMVQVTAESVEPPKTTEMDVLNRIMKRSLKTKNKPLHDAVVALIGEVLLEE